VQLFVLFPSFVKLGVVVMPRRKKPEALDVFAMVKARKGFSKAELMSSFSGTSGGVSG